MAGGGLTGSLAATEKAPAGAVKAQTVPKRKLGKTGLEVSSLCLGGMSETINNQGILTEGEAPSKIGEIKPWFLSINIVMSNPIEGSKPI